MLFFPFLPCGQRSAIDRQKVAIAVDCSISCSRTQGQGSETPCTILRAKNPKIRKIFEPPQNKISHRIQDNSYQPIFRQIFSIRSLSTPWPRDTYQRDYFSSSLWFSHLVLRRKFDCCSQQGPHIRLSNTTSPGSQRFLIVKTNKKNVLKRTNLIIIYEGIVLVYKQLPHVN